MRMSLQKILTAFCVAVALVASAVFAMPAFAATTNEVNLTVSQSLTGTGAKTAQGVQGSYVLRAVDGVGGLDTAAPMPTGASGGEYAFTIEEKASKTLTFTVDREGNFLYELTSTGVNQGSISSTVYTIRVEAHPNAQGVLEVKTFVYGEDGSKRYEMPFEITILSEDGPSPVYADPPVEKKVTGNPATAGTFLFEMRADNASWPMPEGSENGVKTMTIVGPGSEEFGLMEFTESGVYTYQVREIDTSEKGYTYDKANYTVTITVTDDGTGKLSLKQVITENSSGAVADSCLFTNAYSDEPTPDPDPDPDPDPNPNPNPDPNPKPDPKPNPSPDPKKGSQPKTWDTYRPYFWATVAGVSAAVLILAFYKRRKKRQED